MFTVGHIALGYLLAKGSTKLTKTTITPALIFFLAVLPDVDLLIPFVRHRGITHSIILLTLIFLPIFWHYKKQAIPYFIALIQHSLIGDFLTGAGVELFWPFKTNLHILNEPVTTLVDISVEWICFIAAIIVLTKTKDMQSLFKPTKWNYLLIFPIVSIFFSTIMPININFESPPALLIPELTLFALFLASISWTFVIKLRLLLRGLNTKRGGPAGI